MNMAKKTYARISAQTAIGGTIKIIAEADSDAEMGAIVDAMHDTFDNVVAETYHPTGTRFEREQAGKLCALFT